MVIGALALLVLWTGAMAQEPKKTVESIFEQKCFQCHGEALQMSKFDMRTREAMLKGGEKGAAIVPGNAEASLLFKRVSGADKPVMPIAPFPPLSAEEVAVIKDWINKGAPWSAAASTPKPDPHDGVKPTGYSSDYKERVITTEDRNWWAFKAPVRNATPSVDARWSKNPIDAFLKKSMDEKGLVPAPTADRTTLIRRAYLDLVGLLPSPEEVDAFVKDPDPDAYSKLVDKLLASPHYGERWARFWLDVVRYAESSGYEHDRDLPDAWRFRDYVIKSFNDDKPYDKFIIEHIAGDELDKPTYETVTGTAFYRIGPRVRFRENDNPYYRFEYLDDQIRTTFQGFMGLSVNCARCHDHKFDPITRMDYYRSVAMLQGWVNYDHPLVPKEEAERYEATKTEVEAKIRPLRRRIGEIEAPYRKEAFDKRIAGLPDDLKEAVLTPPEKRTPGQELLAQQVARIDFDPDAPPMRGPLIKVSPAEHEERQKLQDQINELQKQIPQAPLAVIGIRDGDFRFTPDGPGDEMQPGKGDRVDYAKFGIKGKFLPVPGDKYEPPPAYFASNGLQPFEEEIKAPIVAPGFLTVLSKGNEVIANPPKRTDYVSSGRRRALAEWIASKDNPLTARVMVNRIWHWHFGKGIVSTPGNFGKMGARPSNPELLDWLATEFVQKGWSIKEMHRLMMNSEAYKMASSYYSASNNEKDPENILLWKFPVRRLEAEIIRDIILSASGQMNWEAGGDAFFPSIPKRVREGYRQGKWVLTKEEPATWRRSIYSYWKRGMKYPMFDVLDQPDVNVTAEKRNVSTVPTQALTLLNNEFVLLQAKHLAERVIREAGNDPEAQVKRLYSIGLSRDPNQRELQSNLAFLNRQREYHVARSGGAGGSGSGSGGSAPAINSNALTDLAHVMLNANEFVYIN
jgi:hypothetical protein